MLRRQIIREKIKHVSEDATKRNPVIQVNEAELQDMGRVVLTKVGETLNAMLDAPANDLVGAGKYERNAQGPDYRSGHCAGNLHTRVVRPAEEKKAVKARAK